MARRATHLKGLRRQAAPPALVLGGPFELSRPGGRPVGRPDKLQALASAYRALDYDLGVLTPAERRALDQAGAAPPPSWITADSVRTGVLDVGRGDKLGVVVFPALPPDAAQPDGRTLEAIGRAVNSLKRREGVKAVVGLSPWGYRPERAYVDSAPAAPVDLLLGAGPGMGFAGRTAGQGRIYWVRPTYEGKAVTRIDILAWPARDGDFSWQQSKNVNARMEYLGDAVVPDAKLSALLAGFGND